MQIKTIPQHSYEKIMLISKTRKRLALPIVASKRQSKFSKHSVILFFTKLKPKLISFCNKIKLARIKAKCMRKLSSKPKRLKHTSSKLRKTFSRYNSNKDGRVNPENLGEMIRNLGGNPTEAQVNEIVSKESVNGPFDFHRFVGLMSKHLRAKPMDLELHRALEAIDNDVDGYINVAKLRHAMTTMGESLDPEEFDEWIRAIGIGSDGSVRYEDIIVPMTKAT